MGSVSAGSLEQIQRGRAVDSDLSNSYYVIEFYSRGQNCRHSITYFCSFRIKAVAIFDMLPKFSQNRNYRVASHLDLLHITFGVTFIPKYRVIRNVV